MGTLRNQRMSATNIMAKEITTVVNTTNESESEMRQIRNAMVGYYAANAMDDFKKFVDVTESEMADFLKVTENATIVFTMPSEESLKADAASENPRFTKGRKFGSDQWYKKTQVVGTALAVLTSYSSYLRYMDSKEHAAERDEKKLAAAAAVLGITVEELKALKK